MIHVLTTLVAGWVTGDWLAGASVAVLIACWYLLRPRVGTPVLFLAMCYQWMQVSVGLFYGPLLDRTLEAFQADQHRTMVMIGLGCILCWSMGMRAGIALVEAQGAADLDETPVIGRGVLYVVYAASFVLVGGMQQLVWRFPDFRQALVALTYVHLGLFYLAVRRSMLPEVQPLKIIALLAIEIVVGLTGYFANFREPVLLCAIAFLEAFDWRRRSHIAGLVTLFVAAIALAMFWMGVRGQYRQDFANVETFSESRSQRLDRLTELGHEWASEEPGGRFADLDFFIDRIWAVYYPGLAVGRVPNVLPHTDGALMSAALQHIFAPRIFFPDKPPLPSDSELVRKYSGLWVAGEEEETSIAFGYAGESYLDFGLPLMFLPALLWGVFVGAAYQACLSLIRHAEIAVPVVTVIFWLSVYLFERSWAKTMGLTGTLLIYLAVPAYALDRYVASSRWLHSHVREDSESPYGPGPPQVG